MQFAALAALCAAVASTGDVPAEAKKVLAQIDGKIVLPGLKSPVEVLRDRWGVAHIYAGNTHDLFFAQGFVAAQDRQFQLDLWRRAGRGELAEILGKQAVESDRLARLLKYRGDMETEWRSYAPDTKEIAEAFTAGINACIDQFGERLPIEFQILKYRPGHWQPEDILGRMSGIIMTRQFVREVARAKLIAAVGIEKARLLAPTDPPLDYRPAPELDLSGIDDRIVASFKAALKTVAFDPPKTESNNWVVDGTLSASGKPMLASDPHRSIALPSLRYLVHLHAPGWNVIGAGEPGLPGVALGHNERCAWGFTIVGTDQTDLYVETTAPEDPRQYLVGEKWEQMRIVREKMKVKGQDDVEVELRFTRHGPVLFQDESRERRRAYVLRWSGSEAGGAAYLGSLTLDRIRNKAEFLEAVKAWKIPNLNLVYADVEGNIGWVAAALTPRRKGWDGLLPVPGASGRYEWQGFLDVKELPQEFNPERHWIATANHKILPRNYPHTIAYEWAPLNRFQRVQARLLERKKFTLEDFQSIQHDVVSIPGQTLARVLKQVKLEDETLEPYANLFRSWDGMLDRRSKVGPLYAIWLKELERQFSVAKVAATLKEDITLLTSQATFLREIEHPTPAWFGKDAFTQRDALVRETFARAVVETKKRLGPDPAKWSWGALHTVTFHHPLAKLSSTYAKAFNLGPVSRPGDVNTPNNTSFDKDYKQIHGASYRHVFDLADWDKGAATSAPGQSGQPGSPHYGDLLPLWAEEEYFPLYYSREKVEMAMKNRLRLIPER